MTKINHEEYVILKSLGNRWGWIARDRDLKEHGVYNEIRIHEYEPAKEPNFWVDRRGQSNVLPYNDLFQFIQWGDEDPFNTQELIEEYESEETEVKDIEWLKEEVNEIKKLISDAWGASIIAGNQHFEIKNSSEMQIVKRISDLIDQLDEPEVLSQEFIDDHKLLRTEVDGNGRLHQEYYIHTGDLQNILVPEQELPVIPQFVAEYLDLAKSEVTLMRVLELANTRNELPKWEKEYDWISANDETFARAWLDGFAVANEDEEQKFYVDLETAAYIAKWDGDGSVQIYTDAVSGNDEYELHLTEKEIKDYNPKFWPFAVKVEDIEGSTTRH